MATDLFSQYYNNPKKSAIYSNIKCNAPSGDELSFDILKSRGVISNNVAELSDIDLSDVHVPLTQYTNEMKVIDPHSFVYVKGITKGESYMSKTFGYLDTSTDSSVFEDENWQYNSTVSFVIKYVDDYGRPAMKFIMGEGGDASTFTEACQDSLNALKIPVSVELVSEKYEDSSFYGFMLTGLQTGFSFNISQVVFWHTSEGSDVSLKNEIDKVLRESAKKSEFGYGFNDEWVEKHVPEHLRDDITYCFNVYASTLPSAVYAKTYAELSIINGHFYTRINSDVYIKHLLEDGTRYVPAYKYKNGAFKGIVVKATYPQYNDELITDTMRSLKIAHLRDRVYDYSSSIHNRYFGVPVYIRTIKDVNDSYVSDHDTEGYWKWHGSRLNLMDRWIDFDEVPRYENDDEWSGSSVPDQTTMTTVYEDQVIHDTMGLYGYCTYLTMNDLWSNFGQLYIKTSVDDDESKSDRNLIPSFIVYNPNDFPVEINYMTFV